MDEGFMVNSSKNNSVFYPILFSIKTYMNNAPIVCFLHFLSSVISAGKIYLFAFL